MFYYGLLSNDTPDGVGCQEYVSHLCQLEGLSIIGLCMTGGIYMRLAIFVLFCLTASLVAPVRPARAQASTPPVPLAYFRLPANVVGQSHFFVGEGGGGPQLPPADAYGVPQTVADLGTYHYGVTPNVTSVHNSAEAYYDVVVYRTVEAARLSNAEERDSIADVSGKPFVPLSIAQPLNDNEWLRGRQAANATGHPLCVAAGGVRYQNVRVFAFIQDFASVTPSGYFPCTQDDRWATRAMRALYPRLVSFVARHPPLTALTAPTSLRVIEPFDARGRLLPGYDAQASEPLVDGSCTSYSYADARPDAVRCFAGSSIMDPCFVPPVARPTIVACVRDPHIRYADILHLASPLHPVGEVPPKAGQGQPWAFDLVTAEQCGYEGGATLSIGGNMRLNYGCTPAGSIYGNINKSTRQWTALVWRGAMSVTPTQSQLVRVGVLTAYF